MRSGSLWSYYRDEIDDADDNASFFWGKTEARPDRPAQSGPDAQENQQPRTNQPSFNAEVVVLLRYLSKFQRSLDLTLVNCEIELELNMSKTCLLIEEDDHITDASFTNTSTKIYVIVVTLSINNNIKLLENIKQGFKRTISWNKYRSEITVQPKTNDLDYLIDSRISSIYILFVLSFKNDDHDPTIKYFCEYYMPLLEIKDFNVLIGKKPFFDQPVKIKQEAYKKLTEMSRNGEYTAGNL